MELYFLRHAIAVARGSAGYPDDDRPLTDEGIAKMRQAAKGIARLVDDFDLIAASPLRRAHTTAEIVIGELNRGSVSTCDALLPGADPDALWSFLREHRNKKRILLVGHEPHLSKTASLLLGSARPLMEFRKGGMCRIDLEALPPRGHGILLWHLTPKQLRQLAES